MSERASHLVVTVSMDGDIDVFSSHRSSSEAWIMRDKLSALIGAAGTRIHVLDVPELDGVPVPAAQAVPTPLTLPAPPPAKFVRPKSQAEFELETMAMMNGEAPMDGIQWRDADAPFSEGGAVF